MNRFIRKGARKAFTRIELLLVLAVTVILLSLFAPIMVDRPSKSYTVACLQNLKQISSAWME